MEDVCGVFCYSKVFDDVVQIAVVLVCGMTAFCAGEGDGGHDVGTALGEVEKDSEEAKICIVVVCWLGGWVGVLSRELWVWVGWGGLGVRVFARWVQSEELLE